jgi:hypothetical protein
MGRNRIQAAAAIRDFRGDVLCGLWGRNLFFSPQKEGICSLEKKRGCFSLGKEEGTWMMGSSNWRAVLLY